MSWTRGLVTDTIEFSSVDGPGNRFVVFMQGCTFNCGACHNPYTIKECIDCGDCIPACPTGALSIGDSGRIRWNEAVCEGGEACIAACPHDSTPKARTRRVDDLLGQIRRAAPFLSGLTVSGGEATMQASFVADLFAAVKADPATSRLTCFVDSNGDADPDVWETLRPTMDAAMVDLKCLDPLIHAEMTGAGNHRVLETIALLHEWGKLYEVRLLMLAGVNDDDDLLRRTGDWLASIDGRMRVSVIGFRGHGVRPAAHPLVAPGAAARRRYADILASRSDFDLRVI